MSPRSLDNTDARKQLSSTRNDCQLSTPSIEAKAWSPSYSSPDFKLIMDLENKKLTENGFHRDPPRALSQNKSYRSMPSLNETKENNIHATPQTQRRAHGKENVQHKYKG